MSSLIFIHILALRRFVPQCSFEHSFLHYRRTRVVYHGSVIDFILFLLINSIISSLVWHVISEIGVRLAVRVRNIPEAGSFRVDPLVWA